MDEEENTLYRSIILACIVGIVIASIMLYQSKPAPEEFSELYFVFERVDLTEGKGVFHGCTLEVSATVWIDLDRDGTRSPEETFLAGDTFVLENEFWNISDIARDNSQILFGKFPKTVRAGIITFSFVIVNHLAEDHLYVYTVSADGSTQEGTIPVKKGEKKVVVQSLTVERGNHKVVISLDTGEEIHFYLSVE